MHHCTSHVARPTDHIFPSTPHPLFLSFSALQDLTFEALCQHQVGIILKARCCLSGTRHGTIRYVGLVPELDGPGPWVGIELDEPTGKNDGSLSGTRYFDAKPNTGVFVREKRVEVGRFGVLLEEELGSDMEEL